jgi:hypothetical protein
MTRSEALEKLLATVRGYLSGKDSWDDMKKAVEAVDSKPKEGQR